MTWREIFVSQATAEQVVYNDSTAESNTMRAVRVNQNMSYITYLTFDNNPLIMHPEKNG